MEYFSDYQGLPGYLFLKLSRNESEFMILHTFSLNGKKSFYAQL